MHRLNRTAHAPRSAAIFLFLGLAILPFSLKVAGFQVGFNPSLSAAVDAWQQLADLFGTGYQQAPTLAVSSINDPKTEPLIAVDSPSPSPADRVCATVTRQVMLSLHGVSQPPASKAAMVRAACPKAASRVFAARRFAVPAVVAAAIKGSLEDHSRLLEALGAIKLDTATREELLKRVEKHMGEWSLGTARNLSIPQNLRVIIQMKPPAIPSATKAAECKVRAALESAQKLERERAMLTASPATGPDYCEF